MYANINLGNISLPRLIFTLQYNYSLLQVDFILVIRTDQPYCHFDISRHRCVVAIHMAGNGANLLI